jgi:hypothetical protein
MLPEFSPPSAQFRSQEIAPFTISPDARTPITPLSPLECKDMYILHLKKIFFRPPATYFRGSGWSKWILLC